MTGARTSFTCSTEIDQDIIDWLDSFGSRDRGYAIKAAIRAYMLGETSTPSTEGDFTSLEERITEVLRELVAMRRENKKNSELLALSINNDTIGTNKDLSDTGEVDPVVLENINSLFNEE